MTTPERPSILQGTHPFRLGFRVQEALECGIPSAGDTHRCRSRQAVYNLIDARHGRLRLFIAVVARYCESPSRGLCKRFRAKPSQIPAGLHRGFQHPSGASGVPPPCLALLQSLYLHVACSLSIHDAVPCCLQDPLEVPVEADPKGEEGAPAAGDGE